MFPRSVSADGVGAQWKLELRTTSFGRVGGARELGDAALNARGERIELDHGSLVEWFENTSSGLEQGWTIPARLDGDAPLWIGLDFRGLSLRIDDGARSGVLVDANGAPQLRYSKLLAFDATGRELCARLAPSASGVGIEVDDERAIYPIVVDPVLTGPPWVSFGNQTGPGFGCSVSTAGDVNGDGYSDVIVGAMYYDNGQADEGRAFVFLGSATGLAAAPAWTAESDQANALFGQVVATAGDVNGDGYDDVIVGARTYDNGQADEGRAFVYLGSSSGLSASAAWTAEGNQPGANLGSDVASAGDVNSDGFDDVIVGAVAFDNGHSDEGLAQVFLGSATGLAANAVWSIESNQTDAQLGDWVAGAGDVNGDGYADVAVGLSAYDNGNANEGAAWVFHGSSSGPSGSPSWTWEPNFTGAEFGTCVAAAGDVNADGYDDLVVGAPNYDSPQTNEGVVFLFMGSSGGLAATPITYEWNQDLSYLGRTQASAGDVNGDGYSDVIFAAPWFDSGNSDEGHVWVYRGTATGLEPNDAWVIGGDQDGALLGFAAACAGDVNGDGFSDVVLGAPFFDDGETDEGRVSVYFGSASEPASTSAWTGEGNQVGAWFGYSVASAGDVNGDGYGDVVVGAPYFDNGELNEGAAFVFLGSASGLGAAHAWMAESNQISAFFGFSVASAGDVNGDGYGDVIVGAHAYDNDLSDEGRAFVYLGSPAGLSPTLAWTAESDQVNPEFGYSVASAGDVNGDGFGDVVVGCPAYDNGQINEGAAFIYHGSAQGLGPTYAHRLEGNHPNARFGRPVACAGDVDRDGFSDIVVGAWTYENGLGIGGRAFLFRGSQYGLDGNVAWSAEGGQLNAAFGACVASAGDVNGDGFSDVIVGAPQFTNGQLAEGRAYVYAGSASGLMPAPLWTVESDQAYASFGAAAAAGDVDGDGFSDLVISAPRFDNGQSDEGRVWIHRGYSNGLGAAELTIEIDQAYAHFGSSTASAGDVDGDGFADVLVGADLYDNGFPNTGSAFVYFGNAGRGSAVRGAQQRRSDDSAPIALLGRSDSYNSVRLALTLTELPVPSTGSDRAWLEWEVKPIDTPLDGTNLGRSAIGQSIAGNLPLSFNELVTGLTSTLPYQWRVRIATDNPLYPHSPWVTQAATGKTGAKFRTLGGVVCPSSVNYCTSSLTTSGCTPVMSSTGTPSASAPNGFSLHATSLEGAKSGLFFYGLSGPHSSTWGTGFLCVKSPTQRTPSNGTGGANGTCGGALSIDWRDYMSTHPFAIGHPLLEGKTFWAQCWFRDPPAPKTTNLSDGLRFTICL